MEEVIIGGDSMGLNVLNYVLAKKAGASMEEVANLKKELQALKSQVNTINSADLINRVTSIETLLNQDVANLEEVKKQITDLKAQVSAKSIGYRVVE